MSAYENYLARCWEQINTTETATCVECDKEEEVSMFNATPHYCDACLYADDTVETK